MKKRPKTDHFLVKKKDQKSHFKAKKRPQNKKKTKKKTLRCFNHAGATLSRKVMELLT